MNVGPSRSVNRFHGVSEVQFCGSPLRVLKVRRLEAVFVQANKLLNFCFQINTLRAQAAGDRRGLSDVREGSAQCGAADDSEFRGCAAPARSVSHCRRRRIDARGGGEAGASADVATTTTVLDPDAAKWYIICFIYVAGSHFS